MPVSPQVVIREEEVTNISPNISTTRVALVGTAQKGTVNKPILISTPNDYIATFGEPTVNDFLGIAALNFLSQGNQLYVIRVGSVRGDDPISFATTDTPAVYETAAVPDSFGNTDAIITFEIDGNQFSLNFNNFVGNGADAIAEFFNSVVSNLGIYPILAKAESFADGSVKKVRITTLSRKGEISYIKVIGFAGTNPSALQAIFTTSEVRGKRTVFTSEVLQPAILDSNAFANISTVVQNALVKANTVNTKSVNTLYNVSKLSKEAYKILNVNTTNITALSWKRFSVRIKKDTTVFDNNNPITFTTKDPLNNTVFVYQIGSTTGDNVSNPNTIIHQIPSLNTDADWNNFIAQIQLRYNTANTDNITTGFTGKPNFIIENYSFVSDGGNYVEFVFRQIVPNADYTLEVSGNTIQNNAKFSSPDGTNPSTYQSKTIPSTFSFVTAASTSFSVSFTLDSNYKYITADASLITSTSVEKVIYYILLGNDGADIDITTANSVNDIADLITSYINNKTAFANATINYSSSVTVNPKIFAFSASRVNNQITVTTRTNLKAEGNNLQFYNSDPVIISALDPAGNNLGHGFNDRPTYSFAKFSVDGVNIANSGQTIDFDIIPSSVIPNKHEATITDIVNAINYVARNTSYGKNVASFVVETGNEHLIIFSSSSGSEGTVTVTSASQNIGGQNDPFVDPASASVTGTGDNHLKFVIDDTYTFDIFLAPGNNRTPESIVDEINNFIKNQNPNLPTLVSVVTDPSNNKKIRIQSIKKGNYSDFGAKVEIVNNLGSLFPTTVAFGSGAKRASISIKASSQGTWANGNVKVEFVQENPLFFIPGSVMVNVYYKNQLVEQYREAVLSPTHDNFIERLINGVSKYITVDFDDDVLGDLDPNTVIDSVFILPGVYTLDGGANGMKQLTDADIIGTIDQFGNRTGLTILADADQIKFDILAVPGVTSEAVQNKMIEIAESRQDIFVIIDPPLGLNTQQVIDWHNGAGYGRSSPINSSYAAVYNTWLVQFDSFNNIDRFVPPSAIILPVLAFTDRTSNPWFAPAGVIRGKVNGVKDVVYNASLGERESLMGSGNAINPIVKFVGEGIFVWGDITSVRRETPLKDIGVRRMINFIKNVVSVVAKQILFEPNDPISAKRLLDTINPFLHSILTRRGLTEFKVVDKTTPFDRDQGRMVINVLVKPTRSTKIIEIPLTITSQGVSL